MIATFYDPITGIGCTLENLETEKYWYYVIIREKLRVQVYELRPSMLGPPGGKSKKNRDRM
jgi:hypothetical protein